MTPRDGLCLKCKMVECCEARADAAVAELTAERDRMERAANEFYGALTQWCVPCDGCEGQGISGSCQCPQCNGTGWQPKHAARAALAADVKRLESAASSSVTKDDPPQAGPMPWRLSVAAPIVGLLARENRNDHGKAEICRDALRYADALIAVHAAAEQDIDNRIAARAALEKGE